MFDKILTLVPGHDQVLVDPTGLWGPMLLFLGLQLVFVDSHLVEAVSLVEREQDECDDEEDKENSKEDRPTSD